MSKLKLVKLSPKKIKSDLYAQIINLHKDLVSDEKVSRFLIDSKDILHLYFDSKTKELVGCIGFKWTILQEDVFIYIGATVIKPAYQKAGILSRSLMETVAYTYLRYPFKMKYAVAFATTPHAYHYFSHLYEYWPRPDQDTPQEVINIWQRYANANHLTQYQIVNNVLINNQLMNKVDQKDKINLPDPKIMNYFISVNPNYQYGAQILCMVPFSIINFYYLGKEFFIKWLQK